MEDDECANGNMHYDPCGKNWNDKLSNLNARSFSFTPTLSQCELKCNWFRFDGWAQKRELYNLEFLPQSTGLVGFKGFVLSWSQSGLEGSKCVLNLFPLQIQFSTTASPKKENHQSGRKYLHFFLQNKASFTVFPATDVLAIDSWKCSMWPC